MKIEIGWAAQIGMFQRRSVGRRLQRLAIKRAFQDGLHAGIGAGSGRQGAPRRRFQALVREALAQAQDAETGSIAHLGMRPAFQNGGEQLGGGGSDRLPHSPGTRAARPDAADTWGQCSGLVVA